MQNSSCSAEVLGFRVSPRRVQDFRFDCGSVRSRRIDGESRKDQQECPFLTWCCSSWVFFGLGELARWYSRDHMSHSFFLRTTKMASAVEWFSIHRLVMAVFPVLALQYFRSELKRDSRWSRQTSQGNFFHQVGASREPGLIFFQESLAEIEFQFGQCLGWGQSFKYLGILVQVECLHVFSYICFSRFESNRRHTSALFNQGYRKRCAGVWIPASVHAILPETVLEERKIIRAPRYATRVHASLSFLSYFINTLTEFL